MDYNVFQNVPFGFVIALATVKKLVFAPNFPAEMVRLSYRGEEANQLIHSENVQPCQLKEDTDNDDITSRSEN